MSVDRIRQLPCWRGDIRAEVLKGGLSNESWKVTDESTIHMQNFLDCMKSRKQPNSPVELGNRVLVGAHLANESFRSGKRVNWDPIRWKHA